MDHISNVKSNFKRWVLSVLLNDSKVSESFMCCGSWFHRFGQAHAKDRSPWVVVLDLGTDRFFQFFFLLLSLFNTRTHNIRTYKMC